GPPGPSIERSDTEATSAGGAMTAIRASYSRRASATGKVCVAGTPVPRSSSAWICGSTAMARRPPGSGGQLDAEGTQAGRHALAQQADLAQVAHQAVVQVAAEVLAERRLVAAGGALAAELPDLLELALAEAQL